VFLPHILALNAFRINYQDKKRKEEEEREKKLVSPSRDREIILSLPFYFYLN